MLAPLLGGSAAEKVLLYLHNYEEGHVQLIARTMDLYPSQVSSQLRKFEDLGLIESREIGRSRVFNWRNGNPFVGPLRALLAERLKHTHPDEIEKRFRARRRPRRSGKPL